MTQKLKDGKISGRSMIFIKYTFSCCLFCVSDAWKFFVECDPGIVMPIDDDIF